MESLEDQTESVREHLDHHDGRRHKDVFTSRVAVSTAVLAVFAAITSLMAGHHANEAMVDQIKASNEWNFYQAKSIKAALLASKIELLHSLKAPVDEGDQKKTESYEKDKAEISEKAKVREEMSEKHLATHVRFARSVTMFQVAIGIGAIAALTKRRKFLGVSVAFGLIGLVFMIWGFLPHAH